jgi:hypothetical protein
LKPWGRIKFRVRRAKQSIYEPIAESEAEQQAQQYRQQKAPHFPTNIIDSDDMCVILNARATVLLNTSFYGLEQQKRIVALSSLAIWL